MNRMSLATLFVLSMTLMNPQSSPNELALQAGGAPAAGSIYKFQVDDIDGKPVRLDKFAGQVLLVVNVASKCGNTPQYEGLEALYRKYRARGFSVLGFPANQFRNQEPGTNADIKAFCTERYGVTFPMFSKIVVTGPEIHPLYSWLVANAPYHDDIEWNFAKFLIDRKGMVCGRFLPKVQPNDPALIQAIERALESKP